MLGKYSYHQIIRKTIASFGTLFNNIFIMHEDANGSNASLMKVPIAYGPIQKFLSRIEEKPDLKKRVAITLPRMSFEMTSIQYDASRKSSTMQTFNVTGNGNPRKVFMPVPYNIGIQLNVITKYQDDMLQIVEQILPHFQPHFNVTVDLTSSIGEKRDIPIILESISMDDNYEGDFTTRRNLIYTFNFIVKTFIFGPIADSTEGLIKKVQVDYYTNTDTSNYTRQLRYVATPRALKDYDGDETTVLAQNIDDTITKFEVSDASLLIENSYIMINKELMFIKTIEENTLFVSRAQDGSIISDHFEGDSINAITSNDDELIEYGDDFGFNEESFDFGDGKIWSPKKLEDI